MSRRGKNNGPGGLSAEDAALFSDAMRDVEIAPGKEKSPVPLEDKAKSPPRRERPPLVKPPVASPTPKLPELFPGRSGDVDSRTMDRLRRGRLRPQARLDLHGMTQQQAQAALNGFIADAAGEGARCVLVITGKGSISQGGGVIRNRFPAWLNMAPVRQAVIAFSEAQPRDGGAGAFYVLLRRRRAGRT